ncbi:MAG: hypothetical protein RLZZ609_2958 [Cyanobacteriota bacterium]|jgi:hypothetical protein
MLVSLPTTVAFAAPSSKFPPKSSHSKQLLMDVANTSLEINHEFLIG